MTNQIMSGDKLTREQAVQIFGEAVVDKLERENCEPTNRVGYNGACQGDNYTEWKASVKVDHTDWSCLEAWYYTTNEEDARMAECDGDGAAINWTIDCYTVG